MQLACSNNQVAMVTENEAKLCSRIKELQLRIDQLEFDIERGKSSPGGVLNHSSVGWYFIFWFDLDVFIY